MPNHRIAFDESAFVQDYLCGGLTYSELAARYGLSASLVGKIIRGERHPEVAKRIADAVEVNRRRVRRCLEALLDDAVSTLAEAMRGGGSRIALAAAKIVLDRALDAELPLAPRAPTLEEYHGRTLMDLSPATKRLVLTELGGPLDDEPGYKPPAYNPPDNPPDNPPGDPPGDATTYDRPADDAPCDAPTYETARHFPSGPVPDDAPYDPPRYDQPADEAPPDEGPAHFPSGPAPEGAPTYDWSADGPAADAASHCAMTCDEPHCDLSTCESPADEAARHFPGVPAPDSAPAYHGAPDEAPRHFPSGATAGAAPGDGPPYDGATYDAPAHGAPRHFPDGPAPDEAPQRPPARTAVTASLLRRRARGRPAR